MIYTYTCVVNIVGHSIKPFLQRHISPCAEAQASFIERNNNAEERKSRETYFAKYAFREFAPHCALTYHARDIARRR